jgi:hypothetical protein
MDALYLATKVPAVPTPFRRTSPATINNNAIPQRKAHHLRIYRT